MEGEGFHAKNEQRSGQNKKWNGTYVVVSTVKRAVERGGGVQAG